eukprot:TRINITY_DN13011_c0_g1_i1.p1 TRINITY_DN13011_c0_g1~~TRINITY_DN13011_c0_g1_i1.p1  ORF type:complete len:574 (-),score=70.09 TRINITY_DN13011_c0_g1_i1:60-1721(-)
MCIRDRSTWEGEPKYFIGPKGLDYQNTIDKESGIRLTVGEQPYISHDHHGLTDEHATIPKVLSSPQTLRVKSPSALGSEGDPIGVGRPPNGSQGLSYGEHLRSEAELRRGMETHRKPIPSSELLADEQLPGDQAFSSRRKFESDRSGGQGVFSNDMNTKPSNDLLSGSRTDTAGSIGLESYRKNSHENYLKLLGVLNREEKSNRFAPGTIDDREQFDRFNTARKTDTYAYKDPSINYNDNNSNLKAFRGVDELYENRPDLYNKSIPNQPSQELIARLYNQNVSVVARPHNPLSDFSGLHDVSPIYNARSSVSRTPANTSLNTGAHRLPADIPADDEDDIYRALIQNKISRIERNLKYVNENIGRNHPSHNKVMGKGPAISSKNISAEKPKTALPRRKESDLDNDVLLAPGEMNRAERPRVSYLEAVTKPKVDFIARNREAAAKAAKKTGKNAKPSNFKDQRADNNRGVIQRMYQDQSDFGNSYISDSNYSLASGEMNDFLSHYNDDFQKMYFQEMRISQAPKRRQKESGSQMHSYTDFCFSINVVSFLSLIHI